MRKESFSRKVFLFFNTLFMICLVVIMVAPYLNIIAKAFNDGKDTAMGGITIFPRVFTLDNFKTLLSDKALPRAAVVSVARVICDVVLTLFVQFSAAYVFTHKDLVGRSGLLMFFMIPAYFGGGLIPRYILYSNTGLLNNFLLYFVPGCFSLYNMIIIRTFINSLPDSLPEAAKLDGASEMQILMKVIMPLSKPIMATIALWTAVGSWSDWTTTMYFFTDKKMYTLQYVLVQILKESQKIQAMISEAALRGEFIDEANIAVTSEAVKSAMILVTTLPIVMVYPFLQKYFIKGVTVGAVKD
ncbi:MAG: carbohydrate ABC transporter permease [Lachnospiraceae bacterium]|nr:carbohydrate ABC transporter permease [Lachnospiraceae bacterium]